MRKAALLFAVLFCLAPCVCAAEPYFITLQKLELKKDGGEWVDIIEPDHKVDLAETEAVVSFFNNGRVPAGDFRNFRLSFEDHGKDRQMSRREDLAEPFTVKKGSFVSVSFELDLESRKVLGTHLTVDQKEFIDPGDNIELKG